MEAVIEEWPGPLFRPDLAKPLPGVDEPRKSMAKRQDVKALARDRLPRRAGIMARLTDGLSTGRSNGKDMQQLLEFSANHPFLVTALLALIVLVVVNELRLQQGGAEIAPADAVRLINSGALILDVRGGPQFEKGHILNARNIPLAELNERLDKLDRFRDKPVLTCCDTGPSGGRAAGVLRKASFSQVHNLKGGLAAWQRESFPLSREQKKTARKGKRK